MIFFVLFPASQHSIIDHAICWLAQPISMKWHWKFDGFRDNCLHQGYEKRVVFAERLNRGCICSELWACAIYWRKIPFFVLKLTFSSTIFFSKTQEVWSDNLFIWCPSFDLDCKVGSITEYDPEQTELNWTWKFECHSFRGNRSLSDGFYALASILVSGEFDYTSNFNKLACKLFVSTRVTTFHF